MGLHFLELVYYKTFSCNLSSKFVLKIEKISEIFTYSFQKSVAGYAKQKKKTADAVLSYRNNFSSSLATPSSLFVNSVKRSA